MKARFIIQYLLSLFISLSIFATPSLDEINSEFDSAARKYDIPAPLLKAIAYKQSTWNVNFGKDDEMNQGMYGIMGLYQDNRVSSVQYGAKLLNIDPIYGIINYKWNIEMAAKIISEIKEDYINAGDDIEEIEDYYNILIDYFDYDESIKVFSEGLVIKIYALINLGYEVNTDDDSIEISGYPVDISNLQTVEISKFYKKYTEISSLSDIQFISSPNRSSRVSGVTIDQIVIHLMQGYFEGTISHFKNSSSDVSAHYLVGQDGEIVQMVKLRDKAWHAGSHNSRSIGIEHAGFDGASYHSDQYATETEYKASAMLVRWLAQKYGIPKIHRDAYHDANGHFVPWHLQRPELSNMSGILGHHDCNGKELCPGPHWNWSHYMDLVGGTNGGGDDNNGGGDNNNGGGDDNNGGGDDNGGGNNGGGATNDGTEDTACLNDETPARSVHLTEYKIGKKEVTVAQYKECVEAGSCEAPTSGNYLDSDKENHPINSITWMDAQRYCAWLGGSEGHVRLPTEAEWENAAKGGNNSLYPWGDTEPSCDVTVMEGEDGIDGCGERSTAEVGSKTTDVSGYGVLDMGGNVSEFTGDYYDPSYYLKSNTTNNPKGATKPTTGFTFISVRGGNWTTHKTTSFRNSRRLGIKTSVKARNIGFRCAYKDEGNNSSADGEGTVDEPIELGVLDPGYTHEDSRDTNNATSDYFDTYPNNGTPEYGKEFIYHFKVTQRVRITLNINDPEPAGTDIDLHLFRALSATNPNLVQRHDKKIIAVIDEGDYYISMDSYGSEGRTYEGAYTLHIKVEDAEANGGDCGNISLIELDTTTLPFHKVDNKNTKNAPNDCFDMYRPYTQSEKGKEYVYHFRVTKRVNAVFKIKTPQETGVDTDLQLFTTLNPQNLGMKVRNDRYIATYLEPGEYYLSVDSYTKNGVDKEGPYQLTIDLTDYNSGGGGNNGGGNEKPHAGDLLNPYLVSAANYMNSSYHRKGYDLGANYTHNLYYKGKGSNGTVYMTGPVNPNTGTKSYTQCVGAVHEALLIAMKKYYDATGDEKTYSTFTPRKWFGTMMGYLYQWGGYSSRGITTHISKFKMGQVLSGFSKATPGTAVHIDRARCNGSGGGHSVIFMAFIDKYGREYKTYQTNKTMVGFKYISANGSGHKQKTKGVYAKYAILKRYLRKPSGSCVYRPTLNSLVSFCRTHECDTWKGGAVTLYLGNYYIPKKWGN